MLRTRHGFLDMKQAGFFSKARTGLALLAAGFKTGRVASRGARVSLGLVWVWIDVATAYHHPAIAHFFEDIADISLLEKTTDEIMEAL